MGLSRPSDRGTGWTPIRPSAADLVRETRDVLADVPRFLTAPLLRSWHRTWGASKAEARALSMPGDDLLPDARYRCTRAITVAAPPEEVWPWLVQVGCLRAGWYADDLLDDLGRPSARTIVPALQDLHVGMWLPMAPTPSETTAFVVDSFEAPRWMLWRTPTSTWSWRLVRLPGNRTRLITRLHTAYRGPRAARALGVLLMEFGDFPMMRRMLLGVRERAEAERRRRCLPALTTLPAGGPPPLMDAAPRVLVCYASAAGSTRGIAERIAERIRAALRDRGVADPEVLCRAAGPEIDPADADAVVVGSAVHSMAWLPEAASVLGRVDGDAVPVWVFSVGSVEPRGRVTRMMAARERTRIEQAFPPGFTPRGHRVFRGIVVMTGLPLWARLFWRLIGGRPGDHRNWPAIDCWATAIAAELTPCPDTAAPAQQRRLGR